MRILLVEDEVKIADFIRKGLSEQGYAVDLACDGEQALDWLEIAEFDIIVLDVMLPVLDGIEVCRELRRRGLHTPVLMLTARDAVEDRVHGAEPKARRKSAKRKSARGKKLFQRLDDGRYFCSACMAAFDVADDQAPAECRSTRRKS